MKVRYLWLSLMVLFSGYYISALADDVVLNFAVRTGGVGGGSCAAMDASGSVYGCGLGSGGSISKLDSAGNAVWSVSLWSSSILNDQAAIAVDSSGNIYVAGSFGGTQDFNPGVGVANLSSNGSRDIFILKLDSSGNYIWAKSIGSSGNDKGIAIALDGSGNVVVTGTFAGTVDFDPGVGTHIVSPPVNNNQDIYVLKLDLSGDFVWVVTKGGVSNDQGNSIAVDSSGNAYVAGYTNYSSPDSDIYLLKLDSSGNQLWEEQLHNGSARANMGNGIAVDASGNVLVTGTFGWTLDFDPGVAIYNLTSTLNMASFILKLDTNGNFIWASDIGGNNTVGYGIAVDDNGSVYTTGHLGGSADFDPGVGVYILDSIALGSVFVSKLGSAGDFIWAKAFGGTYLDITGYRIFVDSNHNVFTTGTTSLSSVDFDPNAGIYYLPNAGTFFSKLSPGIGSPLAVVLTRSSSLGVWTHHTVQNGVIAGSSSLNIPSSSGIQYVTQLDANGDGDADILTRNTSTGAWYLHEVQNGSVTTTAPIYLYANLDQQFIGAGDFNNDGTDDVMLRSSSAGYYTVFLLANHAVSSTVFYNAWTSSQGVPQGIGDFDGDGTDDLLVRRTSDNLYFIFRTTNGGVANVTCACNLWANPDWTFQFAGDTNKDGTDDIVIRGTGASADGKWWNFRMNNFTSAETTNLNTFLNKTQVSFAASGDYNGDGHTDMLIRVNNGPVYVARIVNGVVSGSTTLLTSLPADQVVLK